VDIKDYILIVGGLLIVAVIGHGFWLAWKGRRNPYRMDIAPDLGQNLGNETVDEMELLKGELPNGGARVKVPPTSGKQGILDLDSKAPLLIEPEVIEPEAVKSKVIEPKMTPSKAAGVVDVVIPDQPIVPRRAINRPAKRSLLGDEPAKTSESPTVRDLVVIHVLNKSARYPGGDLLTVFLDNGLTFGDMNIFHLRDRKTKTNVFSIANALEPGTFDLSSMDSLLTPGVSFFLKLPGPQSPVEAFETMLATAKDLATTLGGELRDEQMNVMTPQTIDHCRTRIAELYRKGMSKRA